MSETMADTPQKVVEESAKTLPEDPKSQLSLIDKFVTVELIKNCSYSGFIQCIDPVSKSIILSSPKEDGFETTLILGHSILSVSQTTPTTAKRPPRKKPLHMSDEELVARKTKIIAWLKKNLLPVTEKKDIIVVGDVSLLPPYGFKDLCTDNPVVAMEIRKILENTPEDFQA